MPDFGEDDPLSAAVRGRGGLYGLSTATQPGGGALDRPGTLLDQAISSRQNFENRRQALISQIPHARGRQYRAIAAELHGIDANERQMDFEANQRRVMAHTDALEADRKWKTDRETEIDEHGAAMIHGLGVLRGALRNGRISEDEYHNGLLDLGQKYPYALRHPEAAKRYEFDISEADKMRDFSQRRDISESVKLATKYGVQPVIHPGTGLPDLDATRQAVLSTPRGQAEALHTLNAEMLGRYGLPAQAVFEHAEGGRATDPTDPKTFTATDPNDTENRQTHVRMSIVTPSGTAHQVMLPKQHFDAIKSEFEPAYHDIVSRAQPVSAQTLKISSAEEYNQVPSGSTYIDPSGVTRRKP